jgi:hypothetical protein
MVCVVSVTGSAFANVDQSLESSPSPASISSVDASVPKYIFMRPDWGAQFAASLNAFGNSLIPEQGNHPVYALNILAEYQPPGLQSYGVFGFGPLAEAFLINGAEVTPSPISLFGLGVHARYQARYFVEQIVVPVVGYSIEYFNYRFNTGVRGSLISSGPTLGVWILLNFIDRRSASMFYLNSGVLRSYLVAEWRNMSGEDSNISYSGGSYYLGVRLEF